MCEHWQKRPQQQQILTLYVRWAFSCAWAVHPPFFHRKTRIFQSRKKSFHFLLVTLYWCNIFFVVAFSHIRVPLSIHCWFENVIDTINSTSHDSSYRSINIFWVPQIFSFFFLVALQTPIGLLYDF